MDYPKLRNIEAIPSEMSGQQIIILRDPTGLSESVLSVRPQLLYILQYFDGRHSIMDIQEAYTRRFGDILFSGQLKELIEMFDQHLFLETDRFRAFYQKLKDDFRLQEMRYPYHAGAGYAAEEDDLRAELDGYFELYQSNRRTPDIPTGPVRGLIAPHIDVRAGGACFAAAYETLRGVKDIETVVILGTGHNPIDTIFASTRKDFLTPFGKLKTDTEFIDMLDDAWECDSCEDEIKHRTEHTIEFQAIFLQHVLKEADFSIVPILCSFNPVMADDSRLPEYSERISRFIASLKKVLEGWSKKTLLVASADLAHIGVRYGDRQPPTEEFLEWVRREDRQMLDYLAQVDLDGFCRSLRKDNDSRRICGFPPIYTMLNCLDAEKGVVLDYQEAKVDEHNSTVTFTSMSFY